MTWEQSGDINELARCNHQLIVVYGDSLMFGKFDYQDILPDYEIERAKKLKVLNLQKTWLTCRATLRLMLACYLDKKPKEIELKDGKFGKLYVSNQHFDFNISHTDHAFLIGINHLGRIGVDIETLIGNEDIPELIKYAFSENEAEYCYSGNLAERFLSVWTLKESFLKAIGIGLVNQLTSFSVIGPDQNSIIRGGLEQNTFNCPGGEAGSIVYRGKQPAKFFWFAC